MSSIKQASSILNGKTVVVTGAASGIGRAIAIGAASHGAKAVIVSDIVEMPREGGASTVSEIEALGVQASFQHADVSRREDNDSLVDSSAASGGVDVMVCNAGIQLPADGPDVEEADYHRLMGINLDGVLFGAQAAIRQMKSRRQPGSLVFIASLGGVVGNGMSVSYSTSKGGVILLAKSLADAVGPDGIRVNAVCPGVIDTELLRGNPAVAKAGESFRQRTPLRRLGQPAEIGDAVAWLGSDLSSFVSGISLYVDGGLLAVV